MDSKKTKPDRGEGLKYMQGFGNHFVTEALKGALPKNQNNPQNNAYGLRTEQVSGSPFTAPRSQNQSSWLYRIMPSAIHDPYKLLKEKTSASRYDHAMINDFISNFSDTKDERLHITPQQIRLKPMKYPEPGTGIEGKDPKINFVQGIKTICGAGDPSVKNGIGIHTYVCNASMHNTFFYSADGDMLIVPQEGKLYMTTEFGRMTLEPHEICVIQRGIKFRVDLDSYQSTHDKAQRNLDCQARGWIIESYNGHFTLPDLGPIGANGLANPMHFETPVAWFEDKCDWVIHLSTTVKYQGKFFRYDQHNSPFDVVAWHGNYAPYKYDLRKFNSVGSIGTDREDPSIFTVLTCPSGTPGEPVAEFSIIPPRWLVNDTLRTRHYQRSNVSEFMANVSGKLEGEEEQKMFPPGGMSIHSTMSSHGPSQETYDKAIDDSKPLEPEFVGKDSMAFLVTTSYLFTISDFAANKKNQNKKYIDEVYLTMEQDRRFDMSKIPRSAFDVDGKEPEKTEMEDDDDDQPDEEVINMMKAFESVD